MARYRKTSEPITHPWEREAGNPAYVGRHRGDNASREARLNADRRRALIVCDQAIDNAGSSQEWMRQGQLRSFVLLGRA